MMDDTIPAWGLLLVYCLLALAASVAGGAVPCYLALTHTRLQLAVSLVAGLMFGLALMQLFPHAVEAVGSVGTAANWLVLGFLAMFVLQRFLPFHEHDVAEGQPRSACGHAHAPTLLRSGPLGWVGVAVGLSLHSILDGLALASAVAAVDHGHGHGVGLGTSVAVILHKPFCALSVTTLMVAAGTARAWYLPVNVAFALVTPLAAAGFYVGADPLWDAHPSWLGLALAFCAGTFLCIACADLLPELQFHAHDRVKLSLALVVGVMLAVWIGRHAHEPHDRSGHDQGSLPGHQTTLPTNSITKESAPRFFTD
ncbi:MAG: ZIP family metal transporter [Verrucomicrobiota bacterium]|nr:ZIP family metal transporter [Limisphaera sp.]MDW8380532.1 ZIP family metal transporter [Verrucomicrobiota bacterium]